MQAGIPPIHHQARREGIDNQRLTPPQLRAFMVQGNNQPSSGNKTVSTFARLRLAERKTRVAAT